MPNKVQPLAQEGGRGKEEQSSGVSGCNGGRKEMRKLEFSLCLCQGGSFSQNRAFFPAEQVDRDMFCF